MRGICKLPLGVVCLGLGVAVPAQAEWSSEKNVRLSANQLYVKARTFADAMHAEKPGHPLRGLAKTLSKNAKALRNALGSGQSFEDSVPDVAGITTDWVTVRNSWRATKPWLTVSNEADLWKDYKVVRRAYYKLAYHMNAEEVLGGAEWLLDQSDQLFSVASASDEHMDIAFLALSLGDAAFEVVLGLDDDIPFFQAYQRLIHVRHYYCTVESKLIERLKTDPDHLLEVYGRTKLRNAYRYFHRRFAGENERFFPNPYKGCATDEGYTGPGFVPAAGDGFGVF